MSKANKKTAPKPRARKAPTPCAVEPKNTLPTILRTRSKTDTIGDFAEWVSERPDGWAMTLDDALLEFSKINGLLLHLGYAEFRSARAQAQNRLRVARSAKPESAPGKGDGHPANSAGEFNHLLGTKLFPQERETGKLAPSWCEGVQTMQASNEIPVPNGLEHPDMLKLVSKGNAIKDKKLAADSAFVKMIAKLPIKKRNQIIGSNIEHMNALIAEQRRADALAGKVERLEEEVAALKIDRENNKKLEERIRALEERDSE